MTLPASMLAWWSARESREQKLLLSALVFAVAAGLYWMIQPVIVMHRTAGEAFRAAEGDYQWLRAQVDALARMRAEAGGILPVNLPPDAIRGKVKSDLKRKAIKGEVVVEEADGVKHVKVKIKGGEGRKIMRWLEELTNGGYAVSGLSLKNKNGQLSGTVIIGT